MLGVEGAIDLLKLHAALMRYAVKLADDLVRQAGHGLFERLVEIVVTGNDERGCRYVLNGGATLHRATANPREGFLRSYCRVHLSARFRVLLRTAQLRLQRSFVTQTTMNDLRKNVDYTKRPIL